MGLAVSRFVGEGGLGGWEVGTRGWDSLFLSLSFMFFSPFSWVAVFCIDERGTGTGSALVSMNEWTKGKRSRDGQEIKSRGNRKGKGSKMHGRMTTQEKKGTQCNNPLNALCLFFLGSLVCVLRALVYF